MITSLLLVVVALVACGETAPHEGELGQHSLQYVYAFFRHGIRSPLYDPYRNDPFKTQYHEHFKGKHGELTIVGKRKMYEVGKALKEIYGNFIGGYSEERVYASSTELSRTIMTALSVMAGLFPPAKPLGKNLNWQPIPIWQDTREFDKVYFYNDHNFPQLALQQCPKYGKMIQEGYDTVLKEDTNPEHKHIYQILQKETGELINSIDNAYRIYDILEFEHLNGIASPDWATRERPEFGNRPLFPDVMRPLQVEWFYRCQWLKRNPEMLLFYSGPLFYDIKNKLQEKMKTGYNLEKNQERFRYHNTHDDTLLTLRWALGFDVPSFEVEAGDGIAFELHKLNDKYFVQVVYYHSLRVGTPEFREILELKDCGYRKHCPWETFAKQYQGLTPQEWKAKCEEP